MGVICQKHMIYYKTYVQNEPKAYKKCYKFYKFIWKSIVSYQNWVSGITDYSKSIYGKRICLKGGQVDFIWFVYFIYDTWRMYF